MGICSSKEESRPSSRKDKRGSKKDHRKRRDKRKRRERERRHSSSSSSDSRSGSSSSEEEKQKDEPVDNDGLGPAFSNGRVVDSAAYAQQYPTISQEDQDILFYKARTCTNWSNTPVTHETLRNAMKLAMLAPSAYNCSPMRAVFITSEVPAHKERLLGCINEDSVRLIQDAPVCVIVCTDLLYTRKLPILMPYVPNAQQMFEQYDDLNEMIRIRNSNLQAGYLILALRSLGLAVGATCGFDVEKCDELFLGSTNWRSNFILTTGYAQYDTKDTTIYPPRAYRLPFDAAAKLL